MQFIKFKFEASLFILNSDYLMNFPFPLRA